MDQFSIRLSLLDIACRKQHLRTALRQGQGSFKADAAAL